MTARVVVSDARGPGAGRRLWAAAAVQAAAVLYVVWSSPVRRDSPLLAGSGCWRRAIVAERSGGVPIEKR